MPDPIYSRHIVSSWHLDNPTNLILDVLPMVDFSFKGGCVGYIIVQFGMEHIYIISVTTLNFVMPECQNILTATLYATNTIMGLFHKRS